jgi:hypothetical protein
VVTHRIRSQMKAVIDLKKLRSDVQSYQVPVPGTSVGGPTAIFGLALYPEDSSIHLTTTTTEGGITKSNEQDYIEIGVSNLDVANRVAKAMSDAIKKCGGKTVKELY